MTLRIRLFIPSLYLFPFTWSEFDEITFMSSILVLIGNEIPKKQSSSTTTKFIKTFFLPYLNELAEKSNDLAEFKILNISSRFDLDWFSVILKCENRLNSKLNI